MRSPAGLSLISRLSGLWTALVLAFLYLPVGLLVAYSFNRTGLTGGWHGLTLQWYRDLLDNGPLVTAAKNSLAVAAVTTVLATLLGTAGAWLAYRYTFRLWRLPVGRPVLALAYVPIVMPDVVMGVSLLVLFAVLFRLPLADAANNWLATRGHEPVFKLGLGTLVLAHVTFCFPFVLVAVRARLEGLDPSLEEAAQDLGATPAGAFARVILPFLLPAIASGALMSFTLSVDELIVSSFTKGDRETLPTVIYGMAKVGLRPTLNAISAIGIVATAVLMTVAEILRRPQQKQD